MRKKNMFSIVIFEDNQLIYKNTNRDPLVVFKAICRFMYLKYWQKQPEVK